MTIRVNIRALANVAEARQEKRGDRDVLIVPSATLPDNCVMNGILYPAEEIEVSYRTLERTPAPLGHPQVNSVFVSARDPEGINLGWIGAWNENVRREYGRVFLDKIIDVEVAKRHPRGQELLDAIAEGKPVHTSTGVYLETEDVSGDGYSAIARNMYFDHDAILLDEDGAATPADGVGMLVNSKEQVLVSSVTAPTVASSSRAPSPRPETTTGETASKFGMLDRAYRLLLNLAERGGYERNDPQQPNEVQAMPVTDEQFMALTDSVKGISDALTQVTANLKELSETQTSVKADIKANADQLAEVIANAKADAEARAQAEADERSGYIAAITKANLLSESAAKELSTNALKELAEKAKPQPSAGIASAFAANSGQIDFAKLAPEG